MKKVLLALLLTLTLILSGCYSYSDIEEARHEGYEEGYDHGYEYGVEVGFSEGMAEAYARLGIDEPPA